MDVCALGIPDLACTTVNLCCSILDSADSRWVMLCKNPNCAVLLEVVVADMDFLELKNTLVEHVAFAEELAERAFGHVFNKLSEQCLSPWPQSLHHPSCHVPGRYACEGNFGCPLLVIHGMQGPNQLANAHANLDLLANCNALLNQFETGHDACHG